VFATKRAIPLLLGVGITIVLFALFAYDLGHHWEPRRRWNPIVIVAPVWICSLAPILWRWFRRRKSQAWPWTPVRIEAGWVEPVHRGRRQVYEMTVAYAYTVDGTTYAGSYSEDFANADDAQDVLRSIQDLPPATRYNPVDPADSVMEPYRDAGLAIGR